MYPDTSVKVLRGTAQTYPRIPVQFDPGKPIEGSYQGGGSPYFRYRAYVMGKYDIKQQDLLVDLSNIDSNTGTYFQYRVINEPKYYAYDNHMEIECDHVDGV